MTTTLFPRITPASLPVSAPFADRSSPRLATDRYDLRGTLRRRKKCCSSYVHADAQRCNAEMKIRRDNLIGGGHHTDWLRVKALHLRLDRTAVHRHAQKTEHPVFIRDFRSCRSVSLTRQHDPGAFTSKGASIGGGQCHGTNNRGARSDTSDGRRRDEGSECRRDQDMVQWPHVTPLFHAAAIDSDCNLTGAPSRTSCEAAVPRSALRVSTMF